MGRIRLGSHVKEKINGRTGTAYERIVWLFGCDYIVMLPDIGAEGKELEYGIIMGIPYDEQRLMELEDTREELIAPESIGKQEEFFGKKAVDKVTGYEGIIIGRKISLYGTDQYAIQARTSKKGKITAHKWFDEGRIIILGHGVTKDEVAASKPGGCEYRSKVYA